MPTFGENLNNQEHRICYYQVHILVGKMKLYRGTQVNTIHSFKQESAAKCSEEIPYREYKQLNVINN